LETLFAAPPSSGLVAGDDAQMCVGAFPITAFDVVRIRSFLLHRVPQLRFAALSTVWTTCAAGEEGLQISREIGSQSSFWRLWLACER
jgi:hypothetical protein